jgi:hypothetical protein
VTSELFEYGSFEFTIKPAKANGLVTVVGLAYDGASQQVSKGYFNVLITEMNGLNRIEVDILGTSMVVNPVMANLSSTFMTDEGLESIFEDFLIYRLDWNRSEIQIYVKSADRSFDNEI